MIFNSLIFLLAFLPAVLLVGLTLSGPSRAAFLTVASLAFYAWAGAVQAAVFTVTLIWVYAVTLPERVTPARLAAAILPPLAALIYYKYTGFLTSTVGATAWIREVALPAGISFYTFTLVAFAVDRYRGTIERQPPFFDVCLYISFFPHLVAGPILRFHDVVGALRRLPTFRLTAQDALTGVGYLVLGLAAKVLIADTLANLMTPLTQDPAQLSVNGSAFVFLAYSFRIYFDFYGYSLAAIGLAWFFGFRFPRNFDRPYSSLNIRDFWRRWHMTLSFWIRDYLYLPLGGNKRYVRNILITFAICGLWHGAGWNFVAWGLYHGILVISYRTVRPWWDSLPALLQAGLTFGLVTLGWSLFLYDFAGATDLTLSLLGRGGALSAGTAQWLAVAAAAAMCFMPNFEGVVAWVRRASRREAAVYGCVAAAVAGAVLLLIDRSQTFIYFRF